MRFNEVSISILYEYSDDVINTLAEKLGITFNEARVLYYKENFFEKRRRFSYATRCMCSMFSRLMYENFKSSDYAFNKVIVKCCNENHGKYIFCDGILEINVKYDYNDFFAKSDFEKKKDALVIIDKALLLAAEKFDCDYSSFEFVKNQIISENYCNEWVWQTKSNSSRQYKAKVICEHEVGIVNLYLLIIDKDSKLISKSLIVSTKPDEWDYHMYLGKIKWISKNQVALYGKNGQVVSDKIINNLELN